jgi:hypothetical protein
MKYSVVRCVSMNTTFMVVVMMLMCRGTDTAMAFFLSTTGGEYW